jgi:membrane protein YdbS with pleckstrin-like domain
MKVFRSKIDWWVRLVLITAVLTEIVVIWMIASESRDPVATTVVILVCILAIMLFAWVMFGTTYKVDRGTLRIRSGPFRWKVPIDQIHAVEATRSPLSSPALSMDRIRIHYGENRRVMVSPADKAGFLQAIGQELEVSK